MTSEPAIPPQAPLGADYPPDMTLVRRVPISRLGPEDCTASEWLMSGMASRGGPVELLDGLLARLVAAGRPFFRATLHMFTLHPQLVSFTANWRSDLGICDEVQVNAHARETADYLSSPLRAIVEEGRSIRLNPADPEATARYPTLKTLAEAGATDYWAFAVPQIENLTNILTVSTRIPGGFDTATVAALEALLPAFALNVDIVSRKRVSENILDAYVGRRTGRRVLAGEIRRGSAEVIDAVIWVSDMRNFTALSDRLEGPEVVQLLNSFFELQVAAIHKSEGEILKFIGDGLLAIFPILETRPAVDAAAAALEAAQATLVAVDRLSSEAPRSWQPVDMGIALHRGTVLFGNIGAADRVDFTVVGPAVNLAARVEPLTKSLLRRLLLTREMAELLRGPVQQLGAFDFRGISHPVEVFAIDGV